MITCITEFVEFHTKYTCSYLLSYKILLTKIILLYFWMKVQKNNINDCHYRLYSCFLIACYIIWLIFQFSLHFALVETFPINLYYFAINSFFFNYSVYSVVNYVYSVIAWVSPMHTTIVYGIVLYDAFPKKFLSNWSCLKLKTLSTRVWVHVWVHV